MLLKLSAQGTKVAGTQVADTAPASKFAKLEHLVNDLGLVALVDELFFLGT